ncbi:alkaline-phosphatase-like protein [Aspergillus leporis]|uniref:Arylsulfatase n=1 Tax=Aspergillus leporis TaxID=41062 RepID=A0A5N5XG28_9EURO|nr:alkaline-phosphatase-like protein [Aspergillus leporis]
MKVSSIVALSGLLAVSEAIPQQHRLQRTAPKKPNFLFIMTDDQDLQLNSPEYTPHILNRIKEKGIDFANHFVTTALCCPSRVSLWTGRQAHNTNVTDVSPPWGGYPKFISQGFNDNWFPVWFQNAGYNTYYTGKLMNAHSLSTYNKPFPQGFNGSDFLLDPHTYSYYNSTYQRNREPPKNYAGHYTTDVITEKALGFLNDALESDRPFFVAVSPVAPHSNIDPGTLGGSSPTIMTEPIPAPRHRHLFQDVKLPRTPNFNPVNRTGVSWVSNLALQNQTVIDYEDHFYRQRLRALQGVDELVDKLISRLEESGEIDNTYVIYTSDNGFHIGQHRMPPGKTTGFEEDIRVPFFIRGPGIPEGKTVDSVSTHIDLAPTFFELAGLPLRDDFDGTPLPIKSKSAAIPHEHVTVEFWGSTVLEGEFATIGTDGDTHFSNNTYKSARVLGDGYSLYYSVWCHGEHELYDLTSDPYQIHNIYTSKNSTSHLLGRPLQTVVARLDALLLVLKSCQGPTCIKPWNVIHPDGSVKGLKDALDAKYDTFYQKQPKVSYDECLDGYLISNEGAQVGLQYRDGLSWSAWA